MPTPPLHLALPAVPDASGTLPPRPLKVLDITDFYSEGASGGVKVYLRQKARYLAMAGIEHVLVVPGEEDRVTREGPTEVYRVRGPEVVVSPDYRVMTSVDTVERILREERPDVIEVGSPFLVPRLVRTAVSRISGYRPATIGFYHADIVRTFAEPYVPHRIAAPVRVLARMAARWLVRRVYRRLDLTVAASASVASELRELGVPRVEHVSLGVDLDTFRPMTAAETGPRHALGLPEDGRPIGVFVGRFCAEKRLDVILRGHAQLSEQERPHLVFVGEGPLSDWLRGMASEQPGVTVLPYLADRTSVARVYAAADFYLAVGPGETFGLSIAEGIASGLPAVTVDRGAAPDRVAGSDIAEFYAHGEPDSAAGALRRMTERFEHGEAARLRAAARAHAEREFDWSNTFSEMIRLYRDRIPTAV